jgi:hypothetical protein
MGRSENLAAASLPRHHRQRQGTGAGTGNRGLDTAAATPSAAARQAESGIVDGASGSIRLGDVAARRSGGKGARTKGAAFTDATLSQKITWATSGIRSSA